MIWCNKNVGDIQYKRYGVIQCNATIEYFENIFICKFFSKISKIFLLKLL